MPQSAPRPCGHVGCGKLVHGASRCEQHTKQQRKEYDSKRESSYKRGYDNRWRKMRKIHLSSNPLCVRCKAVGKVTMAGVVDHIIPHKGNKELFSDTTNWQSLCVRCHNVKTAREDGGGWGRAG